MNSPITNNGKDDERMGDWRHRVKIKEVIENEDIAVAAMGREIANPFKQ